MITFQNVSKKYGNNTFALDNVSFSIEKGNFVFLVGPTGSGKTTIFRLIIKDIVPSEGTISLGDVDITKLPKNKVHNLRRKVGVIFQDLKLLMDRTVIENVILPLILSGVKEKEARQKAIEILTELGLEKSLDKFPLQLSGGERQRVAIARALIFNPEVLLADEPTGDLDPKTSLQILEILENLNKKGTTILMTTHNEKIIEKGKQKNKIIAIDKGKIVENVKPKE